MFIMLHILVCLASFVTQVYISMIFSVVFKDFSLKLGALEQLYRPIVSKVLIKYLNKFIRVPRGREILVSKPTTSSTWCMAATNSGRSLLNLYFLHHHHLSLSFIYPSLSHKFLKVLLAPRK